MPLSSHPMASSLRASDTGKVVTAREAVRLIRDGDTLAGSQRSGLRTTDRKAIFSVQNFLHEIRRDVVRQQRNSLQGTAPSWRN